MCIKKKGCKASVHWAACPEAPKGRKNDDALGSGPEYTAEDYMAIGMWDLVPTERGDSMG